MAFRMLHKHKNIVENMIYSHYEQNYIKLLECMADK